MANKPNTPQTTDTAAVSAGQNAPTTPAQTTQREPVQAVPVLPVVPPAVPPQTSVRQPSAIEAQPAFGGHAEPANSTHETTHDQGAAPPPPPRKRAADDDERDPEDTVVDVTDDEFSVPKAFAGKPGVDLLMKACDLFGINPDPALPVFVAGKHTPTATTRFRELLNWKFTEGDPNAGVPDKVTLVTAGGKKLTVDSNGEFDEDTENQLRQAFQAFRVNPATNEKEPIALPYDLTLPAEAALGIVVKDRHRYRRGYLKEGGRAEADRRERAEAEERRARFTNEAAADRRKAFARR